MVHQVFNSVGAHLYNGIVYEDIQFDYNFHNSFELTYIIKGSPVALINDTTLPLSEGDFLLVAPNIAHGLHETRGCSFFVAVFSADFISEFYKKGLNSIFYKFKTDKSTEIFLNEHLLYTGTPEFYMLKACLYTICAQAVEHTEVVSETTINSSFALAVNNYIAKNLNNDFSRKDIATALNYEEHYFSTLFNNNFKIGFNKYVNIFRFDIAQRLITSTKLNISDIAYECGFKSIQSFNRIFKEFSGKTPTEYRNTEILITEPDIMNQKIVLPTKK